MPAQASKALLPFGFTNLESEIYAFLLRESPATGYRVAQAISKAAANTYKAIESLHDKGAVLVEDGASRLWRAVPPDELLARLTRDFEWRRAEAEISLSRGNSPVGDDRVYSLRSRGQVVERARHMLGTARATVLLSVSSAVAQELSEPIRACATSKVSVHLLSPDLLDIAGVTASRTKAGSDELRLIVDGAEVLLAVFDARREIAYSIWTRSYLAITLHRGLAAEMLLAGMNPPTVESTPAYREFLQNLTAV